MNGASVRKRFAEARARRPSGLCIAPTIAGGLLAACLASDSHRQAALRLNAQRLGSEREVLAGEIASVSGYLISARMVGDDLCIKILVDEELGYAPRSVIARHAAGAEPSAVGPEESPERENVDVAPEAKPPPPDAVHATATRDQGSAGSSVSATGGGGFGGVLGQLVPGVWSASIDNHPFSVAPRAEGPDLRSIEDAGPTMERTPTESTPVGARDASPSEAQVMEPPAPDEEPRPLRSDDELRGELALVEAERAAAVPERNRAAVLHACRRPPTHANREAARHALQWLAPLEKPERIVNAPTLESLRRELQLLYLARSRAYGWVDLPWKEVKVTGLLLAPDDGFEDEVIGGVDLIAYAVGIHDPHRGSWIYIDLTFGDSVAAELVHKLFSEQAPAALKRAGSAALR